MNIFLKIFIVLTAAGCSEPPDSPKKTTPPTGNAVPKIIVRTPEIPKTDANPFLLDSFEPLSNEESASYFKDKCTACHDAQSGPAKSFYAIDKVNFTLAAVSTDSHGPTIYYAIFKKAFQLDGENPFAMPPGQSVEEDRTHVKRLLKWFELNQPELVIASSKKYKFFTALNTAKIVTSYSCRNPISFRQFISRITSDAFDRLPTPPELKLYSANPDHPVTADDRDKIAKKIFSDSGWLAEFKEVGLRKFARKLSGAGQITAYGEQMTDAQALSLKDEFYQLLLRDFSTKPYKEILLTDTIPVNAKTAEYYGCAAPTSGWSDCNLETLRKSYFGSMSYLRSTPSSFLQENNNYKRIAMMQFFIQGDVILPANDGPAGDSAVTPLPACLKTVDTRGVVQSSGSVSPFGSEAVPSKGNLCQSCHIGRLLASGSILFRPFNKIGLLFGSPLGKPISADSDFATAVQIDRVIKGPTGNIPVTENFLNALLTSTTEQACISGATTSQPLTSLKDLASSLIGDGRVLATGLAKHLPRALSNSNSTSEDIISEVNAANEASGGKLGPMIEAYFASESYSCGRQN